MIKKESIVDLDDIDIKLLTIVMEQGRVTWSEVAERLGLSSPTVAERVRKLEEKRVIKSYAALIDGDALGFTITAFISVTLEKPDYRESFLQLVNTELAIQECHHIAGDDDYLLKVKCRGLRDLEHLVSNKIKGLTGILRTRTTIVLFPIKEAVTFALNEDNENKNK